MDEESFIDDHSRTIIHIDIDCFYAQVEMIRNPDLEKVPLGVSQKSFVITSNYLAREHGIKKCMKISDAKVMCPDLVLVNGEDLYNYRQISYKVTELLQKSYNIVERLGLDENFIDISHVVNKRNELSLDSTEAVGNIFGDVNDLCGCGCSNRLVIGTIIAQELRDQIKAELNLTTCAGIAHNKVLAKLAGGKHKPNQQTVVFPNNAVELMLTLPCVSKIPGIGQKLYEQLSRINLNTIEDLQNAELCKLSNLIGSEKAKIVYDLSFGLDHSIVKTSGKPQSIGLEDSKPITIEAEVKEKLHELLSRLLVLVAEDGRIPKTIKLTVRKIDKSSKFSKRESKQCNLNMSLFNDKDISQLSDDSINKIMTVIMRLFKRSVNTNKPYHLTLLGLAFTKFLERPNVRNTLSRFLNRNVEVQSVTNIENTTEENSIKFDDSLPSTSYLENSDVESEPSSKKYKFNNVLSESNHFKESDSPSKLKVADLKINSENTDVCCPPNTDKTVFLELPKELQQELWEEYKWNRNRNQKMYFQQCKKMKPNSILNYLVKQ